MYIKVYWIARCNWVMSILATLAILASWHLGHFGYFGKRSWPSCHLGSSRSWHLNSSTSQHLTVYTSKDTNGISHFVAASFFSTFLLHVFFRTHRNLRVFHHLDKFVKKKSKPQIRFRFLYRKLYRMIHVLIADFGLHSSLASFLALRNYSANFSRHSRGPMLARAWSGPHPKTRRIIDILAIALILNYIYYQCE